jgi:hypothetical protein
VRKTLLSLVAVAALAVPGTALAVGHPTPTPPPEPPTANTLPTLPEAITLPVTPNRVTDVPTAEAFTRAYAIRNAARFLNTGRDRVHVTDVLSTCLRSPVSSGNFGCVFALNAAVLLRNRSLEQHHYTRRGDYPDPTPPTSQRRLRIARFGCLGEIDIAGGPTVQPVASVHFLQCARNQNSADVPVPTPYHPHR